MSSYKFPGSLGEHLFQQQQGTESRAQAFYRKQMLDHLNPSMRTFLVDQEMFFLATVDSKGECDCSLRVGERGFLRTVDERTLYYPEYRGNGVYSSLGNLLENPHIALLVIDFFHHGIGLHINGRAKIRPHDERWYDGLMPDDWRGSRTPELWIVIEVVEAYLHCSKHIPRLLKRPKPIEWETDDPGKAGGDFFHAKQCSRPWAGDQEQNGLRPECPH